MGRNFPREVKSTPSVSTTPRETVTRRNRRRRMNRARVVLNPPTAGEFVPHEGPAANSARQPNQQQGNPVRMRRQRFVIDRLRRYRGVSLEFEGERLGTALYNLRRSALTRNAVLFEVRTINDRWHFILRPNREVRGADGSSNDQNLHPDVQPTNENEQNPHPEVQHTNENDQNPHPEIQNANESSNNPNLYQEIQNGNEISNQNLQHEVQNANENSNDSNLQQEVQNANENSNDPNVQVKDAESSQNLHREDPNKEN
ncbi:putative uncharacterized protein DDB_G0286901 isoform X2 [Drosophila rhopaloa]|uniref:Uncharacterized protein n=1 Tax=Drosophila rhopaloa TaxID=1041015 RepID=A0A6P4EFB6_DRORH|nr:putative uncharacterized protein DDB_G0286901 isoform X2 [Drosophila rhopaloa]